MHRCAVTQDCTQVHKPYLLKKSTRLFRVKQSAHLVQNTAVSCTLHIASQMLLECGLFAAFPGVTLPLEAVVSEQYRVAGYGS